MASLGMLKYNPPKLPVSDLRLFMVPLAHPSPQPQTAFCLVQLF